MIKLLTTLAAMALLTTGNAHAAIWDIASDFQVRNSPNGQWQYGYYALYPSLGLDVPIGIQQFSPITLPDDGLNYSGYVSPTQASLSIIRFGTDPFLTVLPGFAPAIAFYAPVVRWTAPEAGFYHLDAAISYLSTSGNSSWLSQASIRLTNNQLTYAYLGQKGDVLSFSGDLLLAKGETLDFISAKGQPLLSYVATISSVPEPTNTTLVLCGLALALSRLRKKSPSTVAKQRSLLRATA
jgi:hypothetical protein